MVRTQGEREPRKQYTIVDSEKLEDTIESSYIAEISLDSSLKEPHAEGWIQAMNSEMVSHIKNDTFSLPERTKNQKVLGTKQVQTWRNTGQTEGEFAFTSSNHSRL